VNKLTESRVATARWKISLHQHLIEEQAVRRFPVQFVALELASVTPILDNQLVFSGHWVDKFAKSLAFYFFGSEEAIVQLDMFPDTWAFYRLIQFSPPAAVGYSEGDG